MSLVARADLRADQRAELRVDQRIADSKKPRRSGAFQVVRALPAAKGQDFSS
jgi:hypothetical protein